MKKFVRRSTALLLILAILTSFSTAWAWDFPDTESSPEFQELFPIPSFAPPPEDFVPEIPDFSALEGKSILFFGDSYTMGYGLEDFDQSWCAMLESEFGMEVTCYSIHGSTFATGFWPFYCKGGSFAPLSYRPVPEGDYDVIFVSGGSNDWYCEVPLWDDLESRDTSTFVGAVNTTIDHLQEAYPDAMIVIMTPWISKGSVNFRGHTTDDYSEMLVKICENRDVTCFEAYHPWVSGIFADSETFRTKYFLTSTDPWHLNATGQQRFLPTIAAWLNQALLDHEASLRDFTAGKNAMQAVM